MDVVIGPMTTRGSRSWWLTKNPVMKEVSMECEAGVHCHWKVPISDNGCWRWMHDRDIAVAMATFPHHSTWS